MAQQPNTAPPVGGARAAYAVTNLIKLAGIAIALNEALIRADGRPVAFAIAAFMLAGAQNLDTLIDRVFPQR
jgi:hypothetical protein